jgi:hypothetical protein
MCCVNVLKETALDSFDFRVVFNTHTPSSLGTRRLFFDNLSGHFRTLGIHAEVNNWNCYTDFDVAVVKSNDGIAGEIRKANPNILIGLVHPSDLTPEVLKETVEADFIISGSLEERDYYLPHNPNIFIMPHIEEDFGLWKTHEEKNEIVLGYHGNKHHLEQFAERLTPALEALGTKYNIRLKAIYNVKDLGRWEIGRPKIPVTDIQWEFSTLGRELLDCDIGLPLRSPLFQNKCGPGLLTSWGSTEEISAIFRTTTYSGSKARQMLEERLFSSSLAYRS